MQDPVTALTVEVGHAFLRSKLIFDVRENVIENCDKVRDRPCDGKKSDFSFTLTSASEQRGKAIVSLLVIGKAQFFGNPKFVTGSRMWYGMAMLNRWKPVNGSLAFL